MTLRKISPSSFSFFDYDNSPCVFLKLFVSDNEPTLKEKYIHAANKHNEQIMSDPYPDAGFDLFTPHEVSCQGNQVNKINFEVKAYATINNFTSNMSVSSCGFLLCPRSSLSGTSLRLANSVGIIDSGYRGDLIGKFDCVYTPNYHVAQYDRLLQIVSPSMVPIIVQIVDSEQELGGITNRGQGGFGSTNH